MPPLLGSWVFPEGLVETVLPHCEVHIHRTFHTAEPHGDRLQTHPQACPAFRDGWAAAPPRTRRVCSGPLRRPGTLPSP